MLNVDLNMFVVSDVARLYLCSTHNSRASKARIHCHHGPTFRFPKVSSVCVVVHVARMTKANCEVWTGVGLKRSCWSSRTRGHFSKRPPPDDGQHCMPCTTTI